MLPKAFAETVTGASLHNFLSEVFALVTAARTKASSNTAQRHFLDLAVHEGIISAADIMQGELPAGEDIWLLYVGWMGMRGHQPESIASYLSGVRRMYKLNGTDYSASQIPALTLLRKGIKQRWQAERGLLRMKRERDGITPHLLATKLQPVMQRYFDDIQWMRVWVITLLGVFCLFRSGELTTHPSLQPYSKFLHVNRAGVQVFDTHIVLTLPSSKTQQHRPTLVRVQRLPDEYIAVCPYHHLLLWLSLTTNERADSHLFSLNNIAVTKYEWSKKFKYLVRAAGLDPKRYSGHSLRIGGLSALKESGLSDSEVQILGRWTSNTHIIYWRLSELDHARIADTYIKTLTKDPAPIPAIQGTSTT